MKQLAILVSVLCILISTSLLGHGDTHQRIKELTGKIKVTPKNPELYLKRAELYIQHEDYKKSNRDLMKCVSLGVKSDRINYNFAVNYKNLKKYDKALGYLDKILAMDAKNVRALKEKSSVFYNQKKYDDAAIYLERVAELSSEPLPENYINASLAWELDDKLGSYKRSKKIIEKGIDRLGDLMVFYQRLVKLNLANGEYEEAVANQTQIVEISTRKEKALFQRAMIHIESNDLSSAKSDLEESITLIDNLPPKHKKNQSTIDLKNLIVRVKNEL